MKIGIDLMGGEEPPEVIFEALLYLLNEPHFSHSFVAVAVPSIIQRLKRITSKVDFIEASEFIEMDEAPLTAVRKKKSSSIAIGLKLLKEKEIGAFISTGNTGALIAQSSLTLPLLPQIERAALLALLPTQNRLMAVLDVGAHIHCEACHLVQFALLGSSFQHAALGIKKAQIGLLNIGVEEGKGRNEVKTAYQMLQEYCQKTNRISFLGNIEGREVFQDSIDVLVTDGFSGNIFLKTSEGVSSFMLKTLEEKLSSALSKEDADLLVHMHQKFNYAEYPGAFVCGVKGLVIKCHGNAKLPSLINGIRGALKLAKEDLIERMEQSLLSMPDL